MCVKPDIFKYSNRGKKLKGTSGKKKKTKGKKKKKHKGIRDLTPKKRKKKRKKVQRQFLGWVGGEGEGEAGFKSGGVDYPESARRFVFQPCIQNIVPGLSPTPEHGVTALARILT